MRVLVSCACVVVIAAPVHAQRPVDVPRASGGGELSPSVVATWEAHGDPQTSGAVSGGMTLDLLVLWRGRPRWLDTGPTQAGQNMLFAGPGFPDRVHQVMVHGRRLELRVDSTTNTAVIGNQEIPLQGVNVLMVDGVDSGQLDVQTMWVDPALSATTDLSEVLRQSPLLEDFVQR